MALPNLSIADRYKLSRKILKEEKRCFHPNAPNGCSPEGPIKSHSVSKGMSLGAIAEDGHVIAIKKPFNDIVFEDEAVVGTSGIKVSSVFPGFCQKHDNALFSLIESETWNLSAETCFLLSYRSLANTTLNCKTRIKYFEESNRIDEQRLQMIAQRGFSDKDIRDDYDFGIFAKRYLGYKGKVGRDVVIDDVVRQRYRQHATNRAALNALNPYLKNARVFSDGIQLGEMKRMFRADDLKDFRFIAFTYDTVLPFAASKTIMVKIAAESGLQQSFVNLNVCSNKTESFIVFGWIDDGGAAKDYIDSMLIGNEKEIVNRVLGYLLKNSTNTFLKQSWWNGLPKPTRNLVLAYHRDELNAFPDKLQVESDYFIFVPEFPPSHRLDG